MMPRESFSQREKVADEVGRMRGYSNEIVLDVGSQTCKVSPLIRHASRATFSLWEKGVPRHSTHVFSSFWSGMS